MLAPLLYSPPAAVPLDLETLLVEFDGIRQFARGGRRAPHKAPYPPTSADLIVLAEALTVDTIRRPTEGP